MNEQPLQPLLLFLNIHACGFMLAGQIILKNNNNANLLRASV